MAVSLDNGEFMNFNNPRVTNNVKNPQSVQNDLNSLLQPLDNLQLSSQKITVPVSLTTLKKIFSPSKFNPDDGFKREFINEIKNNLPQDQSKYTEIRKYLFPDLESSDEISDFPSPSLPSNFRKSAPPRLLTKKKKIVESQQGKADLLRIINCFEIKLDKKCNLDTVEDNVRFPVTTRKDQGSKTDSGIVHLKSGGDKIFASVQTPQNPSTPRRRGKKLPLSATKNKSKNYSQNATKSLCTNAKQTNRSKSKLSHLEENNRSRSQSRTNRKPPAENETANNRIQELNESGNSSGSLFYSVPKEAGDKPTLVCTYFSQVELSKMYKIVKKLGTFEIENCVSSRTTHLVCGSSNKTINLCKAVARGCWVLDKNWVTESGEAGKWLPESTFEKTDICAAVKENRMKKHTYGSSYECDIFRLSGSIFVSKSCVQPSIDDLKELIVLGGGKLEEKPQQAALIIGSMPKRKCIKETWILNCILSGYIVDVNKYTRHY